MNTRSIRDNSVLVPSILLFETPSMFVDIIPKPVDSKKVACHQQKWTNMGLSSKKSNS